MHRRSLPPGSGREAARSPLAGMPGILLLGSLLLAGCSSDSATGPIPPEELDFAPSLGVDLGAMQRTGQGLYWLDEEVGTGAQAMAGHFVRVHYEGFLPSGQKFDSSLDRGTPFTPSGPLGAGSVIVGWDLGIPGMREGGRRLLVIPSQLAYGAGGIPGVIPPWSTLVFRVELLEVIGGGG